MSPLKKILVQLTIIAFGLYSYKHRDKSVEYIKYLEKEMRKLSEKRSGNLFVTYICVARGTWGLVARQGFWAQQGSSSWGVRRLA